ncbi:zinc finger and BTB domain-containing protein 44-like isoform X6 [Gigantopelta aegis]|uniref:zinc finger and BTB domain-containing protein 44-like isoform X6 n=1 Tax=Gigantopelta aegis TaxID=1735272 RepID=UPI001B88CAE4|nr:zinc finger and BTB domain-containing protein 44-like isoform X6 [Gigantopelta aegis]
MDKQYSVKFFTSFVEAMQKLCREYLEFEQGVELSGYLAVEIDNFKKERYVLSEMLQSNGSVISESYCTKAFKTLRKEIPRNSGAHGSENIAPRDHMTRTGRSHSEEVTIVLRESPETVLHRPSYPIHTTTPRKQMSSHSQRHGFHANQRAQLSNRLRENSSASATNPFDSSQTHSKGQQREEAQPLQIMPRALEAEMKDSSWNASSESNSPHVGSPSSVTPQSPAAIGQKRAYQNTDSSNSPAPVKKDRVDESLQSLFDAAREIAEVSQANIDSIKNNYPGTSTTALASTSTTAASASATATSSSTSVSLDESIRLPLPVEVKQEKEDDIPYMVIDNPSDTEVKTFPGEAMFGGDQNSSAVYSGDQSSMSQSVYGDSVHTSDSPGGASWDMGQQCVTRFVPIAPAPAPHPGLRSNVLQTHYICPICQRRYTDRNNLRRHHRFVHEQIRKYICNGCGMRFHQKGHLLRHKKSKRDTCGY